LVSLADLAVFGGLEKGRQKKKKKKKKKTIAAAKIWRCLAVRKKSAALLTGGLNTGKEPGSRREGITRVSGVGFPLVVGERGVSVVFSLHLNTAARRERP
jgi:hypothetical protein